MQRTFAVLACLVAVSLAGCSSTNSGTPTSDQPPLAAGKGAIAGLVVDDVFRPVPSALVLASNGLTATTDASGQFGLLNLEPGAYILRIQAEGHEAPPQTVDVKAGEYTEAELLARRVINEGSRIITTEYSVFISCAVDFIANGIVMDCTLDQSGDSDRAAFSSNYTQYPNATYLVTEMKANNPDRFEIQVRCDDTPREGGEYYAVARIDGDYAKMVMPLGANTTDSPVPPEYGDTYPWMNDCELDTILFTDSIGREEIQSADPTGIICCGVGAHVGIRARFVQSLFIGEPEVNIANYGVLD